MNIPEAREAVALLDNDYLKAASGSPSAGAWARLFEALKRVDRAQTQARVASAPKAEPVDQRAARLSGFFRATPPRAATVEVMPKPLQRRMPSMVDAIKNSLNPSPLFPSRHPAAEQFVRPIAVDGVVQPMPSMADAIKKHRAKS